MNNSKNFNAQIINLRFFFIGFLIIGRIVHAQDLGFEIHSKNLNEYLKQELEIGSKQIIEEKDLSFDIIAQPVIFSREEKQYLTLKTYYFFKEMDSTISHIIYKWKPTSSISKTAKSQKENRRLSNRITRKFEKIVKQISEENGKPFSVITGEPGYSENVVWRPNDSTEIDLYGRINTLEVEDGNSEERFMNEIWLYVKNTKLTDYKSRLMTSSRWSKLINISQDFINSIQNPDSIKFRSYLPDEYNNSVTNEQIQKLYKVIDFDRPLEMVWTKLIMEKYGQPITVLRMKYKGDTNVPPKEFFRFSFDYTNSIVEFGRYTTNY